MTDERLREIEAGCDPQLVELNARLMDMFSEPSAGLYRLATSHVSELLAEIKHLKAEREWRPIETAPKDREILLRWRGHTVTGRWCADKRSNPRRPFWDMDTGHRSNKEARRHPPLYWQPLPDPPTGVE